MLATVLTNPKMCPGEDTTVMITVGSELLTVTYLTCSLIGAHLQANGSLVIWLVRLSLWVIKMSSGAISSHSSLTGTFIRPHLDVKEKTQKCQKRKVTCSLLGIQVLTWMPRQCGTVYRSTSNSLCFLQWLNWWNLQIIARIGFCDCILLCILVRKWFIHFH